MTKTYETLWDRILNRLPASEANDAIRILKQGGTFEDIDFFTLKEAEQRVQDYRFKTKQAILAFKAWKLQKTVHGLFGVFDDREGAHLRAHARAMASIYFDARRDHADLTRLLMKSVSNDAGTRQNPSRKGGYHDA